jgi:hypothetical protein
MAMVYDNVKGSFKDGQQKKEKNNSGMMSKELSSLSNAGPTNHSLAYITPEEEKLLAKATGKETITTAYGIPTYESEMTVEEMESKLTRDKIDELLNQAVSTAQADTESRKDIIADTPQQRDEKLTEATENQINSLYADLLKNEYKRIKKINSDRMFYGIGDKIKSGVNKVKSLMGNPETKKEPVDKPMTPQFDMNKDYNLNKFLQEQQSLMNSKEDYFPPQP